MKIDQTRRGFFAEVGRGMLIATVGSGMAGELGLAQAADLEAAPPELPFEPSEVSGSRILRQIFLPVGGASALWSSPFAPSFRCH